ncbi:hypothetical protein niasHT_007192 [Heterodera trifolii]|uniref:Palmitoyltransferase n=1 Tax=Heterodera trifolii TaxID=157864 RepID=A0ABD2LKX5_9BILA
MLTICGVAIFNLYFTCPDLYGDCYWPSVFALLILSQICVNLFLFHYYLKRNQVQFWTAKSSWLFDHQNFEKNTNKALNGTFIDETSLANIEQKWTKSQQKGNNRTHSIENFEQFTNGTYVDLRSELHGENSADDNSQLTKYCYECKRTTPGRCQHCPLCNICVLRKDHHCFLLGGCAGLANQRYFIVFLFWASIGAVYGSSFNFSYLRKHTSPCFPFGWLCYLGPVILWFPLFSPFVFGSLCAAAASSFAAFGFFVFQMIYTLNGYTMHDFHRAGLRRVESDGEDFRERLALVFGRRWWLNFIFPQFWLPNQMNEKIAKNIFLNTSKDL